MSEAIVRERWRDVTGYEGLYQVSDRGRLRSRWTRDGTVGVEWTVRNPGPNPKGYVRVLLKSRDGKVVGRALHRLVLEAFVGPCPGGMEARHLNGVPADNRLENLVWSTHRDNIADKSRHGTIVRGERNNKAKLDPVAVAEIRRRRVAGETYAAIAKDYGVTLQAVHYACRRATWKHIN
jgi:hypothetical protein